MKIKAGYTEKDKEQAVEILAWFKQRECFTTAEFEEFMGTLEQTAFIQTLLLFGWEWKNDVMDLANSIATGKVHCQR